MKNKTMKRFARLVILLIALAALLSLAAARAEVKPYYPDHGLPWATVNARDVNFRAGPGKEYRVMQQWSIGAAVEVLGEQDGWVQVLRWTSTEPMWVWGEYLSMVK